MIGLLLLLSLCFILYYLGKYYKVLIYIIALIMCVSISGGLAIIVGILLLPILFDDDE